MIITSSNIVGRSPSLSGILGIEAQDRIIVRPDDPGGADLDNVHLVHVQPAAVAHRVVRAKINTWIFGNIRVVIFKVGLGDFQILLPELFGKVELERIRSVADRNAFGYALGPMRGLGTGKIDLRIYRLLQGVDVDILENVGLGFVGNGE